MRRPASIRAITEVYVRYRFGGQRWAGLAASTERARGAALADWQSLQPDLGGVFNKLLDGASLPSRTISNVDK